MKTIGFCFLCRSDIHQLSLWEDFFETNYDKCNIYIHSYEPQNITQGFIKKYHIDKNIPTKYQDVLKFDGSSNDLSNKISSIFRLDQNEFLEIIEHSQEEIRNESLDTLVKRITKVI